MNQNIIIIIYGPTAVGKTDLALALAERINGHIINADVAQCYTPLTIGTAKPAWRQSAIPHHLFDIIDKAQDFSVVAYRDLLLKIIPQLWHQKSIPIIVGGSSFYIKSLFFPPCANVPRSQTQVFDLDMGYPGKRMDHHSSPACNDGVFWGLSDWQQLHALDPVRAQKIHPHDHYRIARALAIWQQTGSLPSSYEPIYNPIAPALFSHITRERDDLYARINARVRAMIDDGFIEEVRSLLDTAWEPFLLKKKFIGYDDIIHFLRGTGVKTRDELINLIAQKTRHYAKRQETFWRLLARDLQPYQQQSGLCALLSTNLTHDYQSYINQLVTMIDTSTHFVRFRLRLSGLQLGKLRTDRQYD